MIGQVSVLAATAVVGYDLFRDQTWRVSSKPRTLKGLAIAGSAAALDTSLDLFVDQYHVGKFYNSATGAPLINAHMIALKNNFVPPGATISLIVSDAPATNPINAILL